MIKKIYFDNKQSQEIEDMETVATSSTLLIPESYMPELEKKIDEYGSLNQYLSYLLENYELFLKTKILPESDALKTVYQLKDQNLQRKDFRPAKKDWFLLKLYRVGLNYSISYIFVFLLRLDLLGLARLVKPALKTDGATYPASIFQHGGLSFNRIKSQFSRTFQFY